MNSQDLFGGTIFITERVLDLRSMKHHMITSNIANIDTPHYKAFDVIVEEELKRVVEPGNRIELKKSQPGHLSERTAIEGDSGIAGSPTPQLRQRGDGNSVSIDKEMGSLTENTVLYKTFSNILSKKFLGLRAAIQGSRR